MILNLPPTSCAKKLPLPLTNITKKYIFFLYQHYNHQNQNGIISEENLRFLAQQEQYNQEENGLI